jgi:hypothetical protein
MVPERADGVRPQGLRPGGGQRGIGQVCTGHAATVKIRDRGVSYTLTEFAAHRTAELKAGRLSIGHEVWKLVA